MRTSFVVLLLVIPAVVITFSLKEVSAGLPMPPGLPAPPGVNICVNGFLPAPPGVHVMIDAGRPYYVERNRRVYMERERPVRRYKKYKKHHGKHGRDRYNN